MFLEYGLVQQTKTWRQHLDGRTDLPLRGWIGMLTNLLEGSAQGLKKIACYDGKLEGNGLITAAMRKKFYCETVEGNDLKFVEKNRHKKHKPWSFRKMKRRFGEFRRSDKSV